MSHTFHLVDDDAKTHLWVAQGWPRSGQLAFYSGDADTMAALRQMLLDGSGHRFSFVDTTEVPEGYRDLAPAETQDYARTMFDDPCDSCGEPLTLDSIDGGRCLCCGTMVLPKTSTDDPSLGARFSIADPVTGETVQMLEKRMIAHANTRAAVDLVSNLGVVMEGVAWEVEEVTSYLAGEPYRANAVLSALAERLRDALSDDQAVRAAFLEHFPHLCKEPDRPAGFPQPSSKDAGERSDAAAEKRGDFRHEAPGVDFAELDNTRAQEAKARKDTDA